ncbi:hypothetical protein Y032_0007g3478 [Ancylostoma ceylanicum]|uniref:Uncharacterized protein n=1 Tax=Ancylostoma ceylanicum TaxID=53326 RepID=A0A016VNG7_9BILA|nr:hypothetical protein Y032_0007g3478 [Ancylostoma ceylanicum]
MRHLAAFLLPILVVDVAARIGRKKPREPKVKPSCKGTGTESDADARKTCDDYCKNDRKCKRGVCVRLRGKKKCTCFDCDPRDHTRWPYPDHMFAH